MSTASEAGAPGRVAAQAFELGGWANGVLFHFQLAYVLLSCPANKEASARHWRMVAESLVEMKRLAARMGLDDPHALIVAMERAEAALAELNQTEAYFVEEAKAAQDAYESDRGRSPASAYLRPLVERDVVPIYEALRAEARAALPTDLREFFDLGLLFDRIVRRPDAFEFVGREVGRPRIIDVDQSLGDSLSSSSPLSISSSLSSSTHLTTTTTNTTTTTTTTTEAWAPWALWAPFIAYIAPRVGNKTPPDEEEQEWDFSADEEALGAENGAHGAHETHDEWLAPFDVAPGDLEPPADWLPPLADSLQRLGLAPDGILDELRTACRKIELCRLGRAGWRCVVMKVRERLLSRIRASLPMKSLPWPSYPRDLWLYQRKGGQPTPTHPALVVQLAEHIQDNDLDWVPIELSQVSAAIKRVRQFNGEPTPGRGRPKRK